jgi:hypothetical protein
MLSDTHHPRSTQLPVRRDLSPTSFSTTRFTVLGTADLPSFPHSTIEIACPIHFCDFRFHQSTSSAANNSLQATPDIPELDDSRLPRYLTLTPQTTFLHKDVTSVGS